jgi:hypothetical protein
MEQGKASVRLSIGAASAEVAGSEAFVTSMYPILRDIVLDKAILAAPDSAAYGGSPGKGNSAIHDLENNNGALAAKNRNRNTRRSPRRSDRNAVIFSLNEESLSSLSKFVYEKLSDLDNQQETFTVLSYYLIKNLGVRGVTADHMNECYERLGIKKPADIPVIFRNIVGRKRWLRRLDDGTYGLTNVGENFVRIELPRNKPSAKE